MSEVVIKFDTKDKTMTATIDGVVMDNIIAAEVHRKGYYYDENDDDEDPEFCFSLMQMEKDTVSKTRKETRIVASDHPEALLADARPVEGVPGVRRLPPARPEESEAVRQIVNYFKQR